LTNVSDVLFLLNLPFSNCSNASF